MITRIAVALLALYLVHRSEAPAGETARLAATLAQEAPRQIAAFCREKPQLCEEALARVAGPAAGGGSQLTGPSVLPMVTGQAGAYPLPPRRPPAPGGA